ncbi:MAG TPA: inositol monophosphatase family protein [Solirubrobacteraceae bacterium]|nr:inositol monophosphatase family protein [Solirubrobacteraceae bacterium]
MSATDTAQSAAWLRACRRAVDSVRALLAASPLTEQRAAYTGLRGEGGDRTLQLDFDAEAAILEQLAELHRRGLRFQALSEERGLIDFGGDDLRVIVDPIDGSLNAKRDACHYALSLAVADGETMADVTFGFVHDFGSGEQWWAARGEGARRDGGMLDPAAGERRTRAGLLELVGVEAADPRWLAGSAARLAQCAHRVRALGTIAATLCQVAAARYDGMVTLRPCRGVDAAAGQLIVREAGGLVAFCECDLPLGAPLDAAQGSHLVAARTPRALEQLRAVVLG